MANATLCDQKAMFLLIAGEDQDAFRQAFDLYKASFYAAAFKMTRSSYAAEEIVQEVFILLWTKRLQVAAADNPSAYLFSILYNCIYAQFKKIAAEKHLQQTMTENMTAAEEISIELLLQLKENELLLSKVISQLPPQQQLVYKLSKQEGLSRFEIASRLHISPNSVRNHLYDAVKFIRLCFKDKKAVSGLLILLLSRWI